MKKSLFLTLAMASLFALVSCASNDGKAADAASEAEAPAVSAAKEAALAIEGALDISAFDSNDKWAIKYNDAEYSLKVNGADFLWIPLNEEVAAGETITVRVIGTNNGKGFRCWTMCDDVWTPASNQVADYTFDALPQGDFDVTLQLTTTDLSKYVFIKGPVYGTMLEKLTIKSVIVTK